MVVLPFLNVILTEVKRVLANYAGQFPRAAKIERALLAGGGANLLGLAKYAARELGMPVALANSFMKFDYPPSLEPVARELSPVMGVALGLTLRE